MIKRCLIPILRSSGLRSDPQNRDDRSPITILDLGTGIGDIPIMLVNWALRTGIRIHITATDANAVTMEYARAAAYKRLDQGAAELLTFKVADAQSLEFPDDSFDYVIASQLLHHFDEQEATRCVAEMNRVGKHGILINDLHRHPIAYYLIKVIVRVLGMPPMIVNDAPISVHRGFVRDELVKIASSAELRNSSVRWHLPFRWSVSTLVKVG
ncbi:MAG: methyltransferase domain-containing protein [Rhodothermales bacterium]|nr:methyltransferase domain-containing protein [Rhodothermales bacterium]